MLQIVRFSMWHYVRVVELGLSHSVDRVWRAVSVPDELASWFPAAVDWTPAKGESFEAGGATLEVTEVEPQRLLAWTFAGELQMFEIQALEEGCRLTFTHVFDDRTLAAQTAAGWDAYLSRLEPYLSGTPVTEETAHEHWAVVHEHYAEKFGVDPGPGRKFAASLRGSQD
ncbi:SRPBCC domain-containing protein [Paeniglutamicibacter sp. Y32M11]|nr:SRPBCC domain-containing protein [Paeniglutamicibacter sp. Y32M11]